MDPPPAFIAERNAYFEELYAVQQAALEKTAAADSKAITITLPDGNTLAGESWKTTPYVPVPEQPMKPSCTRVDPHVCPML